MRRMTIIVNPCLFYRTHHQTISRYQASSSGDPVSDDVMVRSFYLAYSVLIEHSPDIHNMASTLHFPLYSPPIHQ